ncbi:MAG TPA: hypothetical protein PKK43_13740 [Spirochaetota bacterium]|nr:hypothetical protein [Spirochaetota bacterium]
MNMRIIVIVMSIIWTAVSISACAPSKSWELVRATTFSMDDNSAGAPGISIAAFEDEKNGIAAGHHSEIRYTTDGGDTWKEAESPLASVDFDSLYIGRGGDVWTSGGYQLRRSHDGGRKWEEIPNYSSLYSGGHYLSFADTMTGWYAIGERAGSSPWVSLTRDGGKTWREVPIPDYIRNSIMAADLLNTDKGYLLLKDGSLAYTHDGGKNWGRMSLPVRGRVMLDENPGHSVETVRFDNDMTGTVILYFVNPRGFVTFDTVDGGRTWRESRLPENAEVKLGNIYLSHNRKLLTIFDLDSGKIFLYRRG